MVTVARWYSALLHSHSLHFLCVVTPPEPSAGKRDLFFVFLRKGSGVSSNSGYGFRDILQVGDFLHGVGQEGLHKNLGLQRQTDQARGSQLKACISR